MTILRAFLVISCLFTNSAQARIVAVLFDDSGSMAGKDSLPSFGAQLLISTLDGRNSTDKLLTAKMSDFLRIRDAAKSINQPNITAVDLQRQAISAVYEQWRSIPDSGTPHHQIEALLGKIAEVQSDGEEAFLIIISDGFFNKDVRNTKSLPSPAEYRVLIENLKSDLNGPLRVEFMLIGPNSKSNTAQDKTVAEEVEHQGIRRALLESLNGSYTEGKVDVYTTENLVNAFRSIIARVASTEIDELQGYISKNSNEITINSPLAVKRVVSVSIADDGAELPTPLDNSLPVTDSFSLKTAMAKRDTDPGWIGSKLYGNTTHLLLDPPLPAGTHRIAYSGDVSDVFLLFQTTADLVLTVIDQSGRKINPNANGVVTISKDSNAQLALEIVDQGPNGPRLVNLDALGPNLKIRSRYDSGRIGQRLNVDTTKNDNSARAEIPTSVVGTGIITADMRIKGFVSAYANPLQISIVDTKADISIITSGLSVCSGNPCQDNEIGVVLSPTATATELARVNLSVESPVDGFVSLKLINTIPELSLARGATNSERIVVRPGENHFDFSLKMDDLPIDTIRRNNWRLPVVFEAQGIGGPEGNTHHEIILVFSEPQAKLVFTGHSQDASGQQLLSLDMKALRQGSETLDFILLDALDPEATKAISINLNHALLRSIVATSDGSRISIAPSLYPFCGCFLSLFGQGEFKATADWKSASGKINTSTAAPFSIRIPFQWSGGFECLKLLGLLLSIIYLLVALAYWMRAESFPKGAGLDIQYNNEDPTFRELHRFNWTFAKSLIWPIFGIPNEQRSHEGLLLIASSGGARIALAQSNPVVRLESIGDTVGELLETNPDLQTYKMPWGDVAERKGLGDNLRMNLLKTISDRAET